MTAAYINRVAIAVPPHDIHDAFCRFAQSLFNGDTYAGVLFRKMASKAEVTHRYSYLAPEYSRKSVPLTPTGFIRVANFPTPRHACVCSSGTRLNWRRPRWTACGLEMGVPALPIC